MTLPAFTLHLGSCESKKLGVLAFLRGRMNGAGEAWPVVIMVTDPPYSDVRKTTSTSSRTFSDGRQAISRPITYGELLPPLRRTVARAAALCEWSAIWDRPEGMGAWKREIEKAGGVWAGTGIMTQTRGAPALRGDRPGCRTLALALARKKGRARWRGRPWAEWSETRMQVERPIVGTRSLDAACAVIDDLAASCGGAKPIVIDPCAGTGIILQAARSLGLEAVGWEINPETHAYATQVLAGRGDDRRQPCLF